MYWQLARVPKGSGVLIAPQIAMEFGTTSRLAASTAAAVQFGVDPQDALDKISRLQERLSTLEQVRGGGGAATGHGCGRQPLSSHLLGVAALHRVLSDSACSA